MGNLLRIVLSVGFRGIVQRRTLNRSHNGLAAGVHVNVLHCDLLLALTAVAKSRSDTLMH